MIRVAIVDDHPVVRDGLAANLGDADDVQFAGTVGDIAAARELVRRVRPDVLLLDLELPDGNGLDAIATFAKRCPPVTGGTSSEMSISSCESRRRRGSGCGA